MTRYSIRSNLIWLEILNDLILYDLISELTRPDTIQNSKWSDTKYSDIRPDSIRTVTQQSCWTILTWSNPTRTYPTAQIANSKKNAVNIKYSLNCKQRPIWLFILIFEVWIVDYHYFLLSWANIAWCSIKTSML
jgi:hypothetical protein